MNKVLLTFYHTLCVFSSSTTSNLNVSLYKVSSVADPACDIKRVLTLTPLADDVVNKKIWFQLIGLRRLDIIAEIETERDSTSDSVSHSSSLPTSIDPRVNLATHNSETHPLPPLPSPAAAASSASVECADCLVTFRRSTFIPFIKRKILLNELAISRGVAPLLRQAAPSLNVASGAELNSSDGYRLSKKTEDSLRLRLEKAENSAMKKKIGIWRQVEEKTAEKNVKDSLFTRLRKKLFRA